MRETNFSIAGFRFALRSASDGPDVSLPPDYRLFQCAAAGDSVTTYDVEHAGSAPTLLAHDSSVLWTCETWRLCTAPGDARVVQILRAADSTWQTAAVVDRPFSTGRIFKGITRGGIIPDGFAIDYPLDRILLTNRLARMNAGVVHASAVSYRGRALLFLGRSGAGKTTIARQLRECGAHLLNDDRAAIRMTQDRITASATPWHGEDPEMRPDVMSLGGLFFLRQAAVNRLTALSPATALASLLANTAAPFYLREGLEAVTATWADVVERTPAFDFEFTPDLRACRALDSVLA